MKLSTTFLILGIFIFLFFISLVVYQRIGSLSVTEKSVPCYDVKYHLIEDANCVEKIYPYDNLVYTLGIFSVILLLLSFVLYLKELLQ